MGVETHNQHGVKATSNLMAVRNEFNHISLKRFLIAGRGNFYLKNTGRRAIWVEKHCSRSVIPNQSAAAHKGAVRRC